MPKFKISEEDWLGLNRLVDFMRERLDDLHADVDLLSQVTDLTAFNREQLKGAANIPDGVLAYHQVYLDRLRETYDPLHAIVKRIALCPTVADRAALMRAYEYAKTERDTKAEQAQKDLDRMMEDNDELAELLAEREELARLKAKNLDERIEELLEKYGKDEDDKDT